MIYLWQVMFLNLTIKFFCLWLLGSKQYIRKNELNLKYTRLLSKETIERNGCKICCKQILTFEHSILGVFSTERWTMSGIWIKGYLFGESSMSTSFRKYIKYCHGRRIFLNSKQVLNYRYSLADKTYKFLFNWNPPGLTITLPNVWFW